VRNSVLRLYKQVIQGTYKGQAIHFKLHKASEFQITSIVN